MAAAPRKRARRAPANTADVDAIVAAVQALNTDDRGMMKHAPGIIVAVLIGLIFWVGATLLNLNTTVTRLSVNVDSLSKSITDLQAGAGTSQKVTTDLQTGQAKLEARATASENEMNRVKERVRILEGQRPLDPMVLNGAR